MNVRITSIHTSCASCHFVAVDVDGDAWLFGRNGFSCLGVSGEEYISENGPRLLKASELGAEKGTKFVYAACGRNHTLLVGSDGSVWSAGVNNLGQVRSSCPLSIIYELFEHSCSVVIPHAPKLHISRLLMSRTTAVRNTSYRLQPASPSLLC